MSQYGTRRETSFPLFYTVFSPVYTNSLMYKMVFFHVQLSMYNTKHCLLSQFQPKNFKEALVSLYLPNHSILISFIYSSILLKAKSLSDSVLTQCSYRTKSIKTTGNTFVICLEDISVSNR